MVNCFFVGIIWSVGVKERGFYQPNIICRIAAVDGKPGALHCIGWRVTWETKSRIPMEGEVYKTARLHWPSSAFLLSLYYKKFKQNHLK